MRLVKLGRRRKAAARASRLLPSPAIPVGRSAPARRRCAPARAGDLVHRAPSSGSCGPRAQPRTRMPPLASRTELSDFLAGVERRAFKQAVFAVRDEEAALDIVQDAMMRLAEKYGDKPRRRAAAALSAHPAERHPRLFPPAEGPVALDHPALRARAARARTTMRTRWKLWRPRPVRPRRSRPDDQLEQAQLLELIEKEIRKLPARQREAFLLRYWEEFDVAETAAAMGCSEGSVKTHCSRATHALAAALKAKGIEL